jgi:hypothetical protein
MLFGGPTDALLGKQANGGVAGGYSKDINKRENKEKQSYQCHNKFCNMTMISQFC